MGAEPGARTNDDEIVPSNPGFLKAIRRDYDVQSKRAKKMVLARLRAYKSYLGRDVQRILEIGCGTAAMSNAYLENDIEYTGIEYLPEMASFAQANTRARIIAGDFLTVQKQGHLEGSYDVVFLSQVFEHVTNPGDFLRGVKTLIPKGLLHLDVPNHDSLTSLLRRANRSSEFGMIQPPHHMVAYTPDSLRAALQMHGFEVQFIDALANDDPVLGQMIGKVSTAKWVSYRASQMLGRGSLLSALARTRS